MLGCLAASNTPVLGSALLMSTLDFVAAQTLQEDAITDSQRFPDFVGVWLEDLPFLLRQLLQQPQLEAAV